MPNTYVFGDVHGRSQQLKSIIETLDYNPRRDRIVFLGDLIDRGEDAPGVVEQVMDLQSRNSRVVTLRGNHEQMLLDLLDHGDPLWLIPENGGVMTMSQYGCEIDEESSTISLHIPQDHIDFLRQMPFFFEDDKALYVHAGISPGKHPAECDPDVLIWTRDLKFFKLYTGKPCFFGHTPTRYLPQDGVRHPGEIYVCGSAIGLDTGCTAEDPLSCFHVESGTVLQMYPGGSVLTYQLAVECLEQTETEMAPVPLRLQELT